MAKLGQFLVVLVFVAVFMYASAGPVPQDQDQESDGWKTWDALKEVFAPVKNYFTDTFPQQTPGDIADNIQDTVSDAHDWAKENPIIQSVVGAVNQGWEHVKDAASDLSEKTFSEIYGDAKEGIQDIDQAVGDTINDWTE